MIMRMFQYKILFRHWGKNKIYPCISTFSLVIGLTCSTLLIGFAMHERRTAHSTPGEDQLYVVQTKDNFYHNSELKTYDTGRGCPKTTREIPAGNGVLHFPTRICRHAPGKAQAGD